MDVDRAAGEVGGNRQEVEPAGHDDERRPGIPAGPKNPRAPVPAQSTVARDDRDLDAVPAGDRLGAEPRPAGDDEHDPCR